MGKQAGEKVIFHTLTIGRESDNDYVIDVPMISGYHARIVMENACVILEDLRSTNGTYVGKDDVRIVRREIDESDTIYFGSYSVLAKELLQEFYDKKSIPRPLLDLSQGKMLLGRDPECDYVLASPLVSWRHAQIQRTSGRIFIQDLRSTNGTFINGRRITTSCEIEPGDTIALGGYVVELNESGDLRTQAFQVNLTLEARRISIIVPGAKLLEDSSLTIKAGEFVGLMGPSGSGKSTLMNALNGYTIPSKGQVLLSGRDFYENYDQYRGQIGYVPQEDIMHRDLTVKQSLYYTARLRLPIDFTNLEIEERISQILEQLGLVGTEDVLIGSPEKKGISGGQRKRVNLAMELISDPSLLFLDEPTSGLSSEDAMTVMKLLRSLADQGKAILLTIHQPSLEAYRLMDHLTVVAKDPGSRDPGKLAYFGPAFPNAIEYFADEDLSKSKATLNRSPEEILSGLAKKPTSYWTSKYDRSSYRRDLVQKRRIGKVGRTHGVSKISKPTTPIVLQTKTLCQRCARVKLTDKWNTALLLVQAPIIAILILLVFGEKSAESMTTENWPEVAKSTSTTIFLMSLAAIWLGCSNSAREIVSEWAIYCRERMVNLSIPAYIVSKFIILGTICFLQCATLLGIVHWGCGLKGPWIAYLSILLLSAVVGIGMGLVISAFVKTSEVAIAVLPLVIIPMVILGGVLRPVHEMGSLSKGICYIMPSRWAFEALLVLEADERSKWSPAPVITNAIFNVNSSIREEKGMADDAIMKLTEILPDVVAIDLAEGFFPSGDHRHEVNICCTWLGMMLTTAIGIVSIVLLNRDIH